MQESSGVIGFFEDWWLDPELNWGHKDFQSSALPAELSSQPIKLHIIDLLHASALSDKGLTT
jgi:hypothetical protein